MAPMNDDEADAILAAARERGRDLLDHWITEGVLVNVKGALRRRPVFAEDEVVSITHHGIAYYLASVLDLPAAAVASVNCALGPNVSDSQRLLWWQRGHGAIAGVTIPEAIRAGRLERCVDLARSYAEAHFARD